MESAMELLAFHFEQPHKPRDSLRPWSLRHLPVVGVFGAGDYGLQPIYVDDLAGAAADRVSGERNEVLEAIGPETFTYRELVAGVSRAIGVKRPYQSNPPTQSHHSRSKT